MAQTGYAFVPSHKPSDYFLTIGTTQEQSLITERFRQNQAIIKIYIAVDGSIEHQIVIAVQPVFLSQLVDQFTVFGKVNTQKFFSTS